MAQPTKAELVTAHDAKGFVCSKVRLRLLRLRLVSLSYV